jgi:beta-galactosidase
MKHFFFPLLTLVTLNILQAQPIGKRNFDGGWKFHLGDVEKAEDPAYPDQTWRNLDLPHDWSIEGDFSPTNPATNSGGSLPGGIGWYRKSFIMTNYTKGENLFIEFDGVYMNSTVWINGHLLGNRPYGYATFQYDLTPFIQAGANIIAVKADNSKQPNSRWYSGSGIYRHVWLIASPQIHIAQYGVHITTPKVSAQEAEVECTTAIYNGSGAPGPVEVLVSITDSSGKKVATQKQTQSLKPGDNTGVAQHLKISSPQLWDVSHPYLYKVLTEVYKDGVLQDSYTNNLGIRSFRFDSDKGFFLNGKPLKILGVCDHHDLGCLGAALNDRALERQLQILKTMGCNAIRTSHNPPAPELLDLCDKMGFLVMDEAFDCWYKGKTKYDFHLWFKEWHERELREMVLRDRNHPSIILWSIGNEIPEQFGLRGGKIARELVGIVKKYDRTRPTTSALSSIVLADLNGFAKALDVAGINYSIKQYDKQKKKYPHRMYIGSETTSAVASRGVYHMPANVNRLKSDDMQCSSYDNCYVPWGASAETAWREVKKRDFMSGLFVWTGFDYIGEPTPYNYPAVSSYFGIIDLCGFPKDPYYLYQSQWTEQPVLHLLPHWNWTGMDSVDVLAFSNCDEVKLYLNNQLIGSRSFTGPDQMHLSWKVNYQPGVLRAEGFKNGKVVKADSVQTAGPAARIELIPDRKVIRADGADISFVTVKVTDAKGILVPDAEQLIHFETSGEGKIEGVDNGNSISLEPHKADHRKAFHGMCLAIIQSTGGKGNIKLTASASGLTNAEIIVKAE